MLRVCFVSMILAALISLGTWTALAQSPPRKTKSPQEVEEAIRAYNTKNENCRRQAREQKLHLFKRRNFIRDCVNKSP
jgi:hypothetical protein